MMLRSVGLLDQLFSLAHTDLALTVRLFFMHVETLIQPLLWLAGLTALLTHYAIG